MRIRLALFRKIEGNIAGCSTSLAPVAGSKVSALALSGSIRRCALRCNPTVAVTSRAWKGLQRLWSLFSLTSHGQATAAEGIGIGIGIGIEDCICLHPSPPSIARPVSPCSCPPYNRVAAHCILAGYSGNGLCPPPCTVTVWLVSSVRCMHGRWSALNARGPYSRARLLHLSLTASLSALYGGCWVVGRDVMGVRVWVDSYVYAPCMRAQSQRSKAAERHPNIGMSLTSFRALHCWGEAPKLNY